MGVLSNIILDSTSALTTYYGTFLMQGFLNPDTQIITVALSVGTIHHHDNPLVRIHSKCFTSEVFGSLQCDCTNQLNIAMQMIQQEKTGLIIYLDQEARGNGMRAKLKIYEIMQSSALTSSQACKSLGYPDDFRSYIDALAVLHFYQIERLRLLTNNPEKTNFLRQNGCNVLRVPIIVAPNEHNFPYMLDKQTYFHHDLNIQNSDTQNQIKEILPTDAT